MSGIFDLKSKSRLVILLFKLMFQDWLLFSSTNSLNCNKYLNYEICIDFFFSKKKIILTDLIFLNISVLYFKPSLGEKCSLTWSKKRKKASPPLCLPEPSTRQGSLETSVRWHQRRGLPVTVHRSPPGTGHCVNEATV